MTVEIWILIIAVFAAVVFLRLGRHRYTRRQRVLTLALLIVLILRYVKGMPTTGNDLLLEMACLHWASYSASSCSPSCPSNQTSRAARSGYGTGVAYLVLWVVLLVRGSSSPTRPRGGLTARSDGSSSTIDSRSQRFHRPSSS